MKNTLFHIIMIFLSIILGFFCIELGLRMTHYQPRVTTPAYFYQNHADAYWTLSANFQSRIQTPDGEVTYTSSAQGLRTDRIFENPTDRQRIFVMGDSYTYGIGVDLKDTFVDQWQKLLDREKQVVDVVNLGVPGYGTQQSFVRAREYAQQLGMPNVLVYVFCNNDVVDNVAGKKVIVDGIRIDEARGNKKILAAVAHWYYR